MAWVSNLAPSMRTPWDGEQARKLFHEAAYALDNVPSRWRQPTLGAAAIIEAGRPASTVLRPAASAMLAPGCHFKVDPIRPVPKLSEEQDDLLRLPGGPRKGRWRRPRLVGGDDGGMDGGDDAGGGGPVVPGLRRANSDHGDSGGLAPGVQFHPHAIHLAL